MGGTTGAQAAAAASDTQRLAGSSTTSAGWSTTSAKAQQLASTADEQVATESAVPTPAVVMRTPEPIDFRRKKRKSFIDCSENRYETVRALPAASWPSPLHRS